jgi:hypothetical protein
VKSGRLDPRLVGAHVDVLARRRRWLLRGRVVEANGLAPRLGWGARKRDCLKGNGVPTP